ncbi:hypothetical protein PHPALM_32065 [Phytophthora palmivora]|uniref:Pol protein n=1 Tax=Phytophthora palmivora TaxID=4796 RepID=A0A2P4X115_9STRA|nr:hypothetical protein PHPALM_32065 [Phytophthora palmivora]
MTTHPTFYEGRLKRYHDPLSPPSQTEEGQGESSPARNEAEPSGQPELPVSKPVNGTQGGSRNSAVNAPMELSDLTTKSVQVLTKDLNPGLPA